MLTSIPSLPAEQLTFITRYSWGAWVGRGRGTECPSRLLLSRESNMGLDLTSHEIRT